MSALPDGFSWGQLDADDVEGGWPVLYGFIKMATDRSRSHLTPEGILQRFRNKGCDIWAGVQDGKVVAVMVTSIGQTPKGAVLTIETLGGVGAFGKNGWARPVLSELEALAAVNGIDAIEIDGRKGWARSLKTSGYDVLRVTLAKDL